MLRLGSKLTQKKKKKKKKAWLTLCFFEETQRQPLSLHQETQQTVAGGRL